MEWIILTAVVTAVTAVFIRWRWRACLRRREPLGQESTWMMFIYPVLLFDFLKGTFPALPMAVLLGILLIANIPVIFVVKEITGRYNKALEKALEDDKEALWR